MNNLKDNIYFYKYNKYKNKYLKKKIIMKGYGIDGTDLILIISMLSGDKNFTFKYKKDYDDNKISQLCNEIINELHLNLLYSVHYKLLNGSSIIYDSYDRENYEKKLKLFLKNLIRNSENSQLTIIITEASLYLFLDEDQRTHLLTISAKYIKLNQEQIKKLDDLINENIIIELIEYNIYIDKLFHIIKKYKNILIKYLSKYGYKYIFLDKESQSDKDIVLASLNSSLMPLIPDTDRDFSFNNDRDVILKAVKIFGGIALKYASEELLADEEVVLAAFTKDEMGLQYPSEAMKENKKKEDKQILHKTKAAKLVFEI